MSACSDSCATHGPTKMKTDKHSQMDASVDAPETLLQAVAYFSDENVAHGFVAALRWPEGPICPKCSGKAVTFLAARRVWKCKAKGCNKQFSVKVGTIFEDSPISLSKWLPAMWLIVNCKNGVSSYELARDLKVTQKTAWFMLHRIRLAMQTKSFAKMGGSIEVDETYIGGRARNMHVSKRRRVIKGTGGMGKVAVMGLLSRHGPDGEHSKVRVKVVPNVRRKTLQPEVRAHVEAGSIVHSDALPSYEGLERDYVHKVINHAECYAKGTIHTNGLENFWSLLKRGIRGTYVSVEPFHLFRYLDEQAYRFNNRKDTDADRFLRAVASIVGRRLTYSALTGQMEAAT
jgi:transposase-like protein